MSENLTEETIKSTWEKVLKEKVDDNTDFFEAGGDSLAAITICSRLEELSMCVRNSEVISATFRLAAHVRSV